MVTPIRTKSMAQRNQAVALPQGAAAAPAHKPTVIFGTLVSWRKAKDASEHEKEFVGEEHFAEASKFCETHVKGLTDEEYKALPKEDQKKYERRRCGAFGTEAEASLWLRIHPLWTWHVMRPISAEL